MASKALKVLRCNAVSLFLYATNVEFYTVAVSLSHDI